MNFSLKAIMIVLVVLIAVIALMLLRALVHRAAFFLAGVAAGVPSVLAASPRWGAFYAWQAHRHPAMTAFVTRRVDPHRPTGLPLSLLVLAALYLLALFSGLTEDVLEAQGVIDGDNAVNAALAPWRIAPLVSGFRWITDLGSPPSIVAAVIIATGFLWPQRGLRAILALWVACLGAMGTTTLGKLLVARHRPEIMLDLAATGWSFPSGHATAAMAVYGFIAYAIARALPRLRERVEIAYWTAVLIGLIGFSRIFLGVHYVTDILGGFMVGGFWLLIGFGIAEAGRPSR